MGQNSGGSTGGNDSFGGGDPFGEDSPLGGSVEKGSFAESGGRANDPLSREEETVIDLPERDEGQSRGGASQVEFDRGGIVSARGTAGGLIVRLDARAEIDALTEALRVFAAQRKSFLSNQQIDIEWVGGRPNAHTEEEIVSLLSGEFGISVKATRTFTRDRFESAGNLLSDDSPLSASSKSMGKAKAAKSWPSIEAASDEQETSASAGGRASSLFDGVKTIQRSEPPRSRSSSTATGNRAMSIDPLAWDEPDARFVQTTVRSGQKLESEHSLVILGDVNNGAEVISGGDILVLGKLRGVAHAGAYEETGGGRMIFALNLQPTQLRIGSVISRGSNEGGGVPEVARVEGTLIVVVPYQSRTIGGIASILQRK